VPQYVFHRRGGERLQLFRTPVLHGVVYPDDGGIEAESAHLMLRRVAEGGRGHEETGDTAIVELPDVMQTA